MKATRELVLPGELTLSEASPRHWLADSFPAEFPPLPPIATLHADFLRGVHQNNELLDELEEALLGMGRAQGSLGPPVWAYTLSEDEPRCYLCGGLIDPFGDEKRFLGELRPTVEHKLPKVLGGTDDPENLGLAHMDCNARKGTSRLSDLLLPLRVPTGYDEDVVRQRLAKFHEYRSALGRAQAARDAYYAFHPPVGERELERLIVDYLDDESWSDRFETWGLFPIPDPWLAYLNDAEALEQGAHTRFKTLNRAYLDKNPSLLETPEEVTPNAPLPPVSIAYPLDTSGRGQQIVSFLRSHHRALDRMMVTASDDEVAAGRVVRQVTVTPEPENPHDSGAVRVEFAGLTIGYLPRDDTARFRDIARSACGTENAALECRSTLRWTQRAERTVELD